MVRTIIVEDNKENALYLQKLLHANFADFMIVGHAETMEDGVKLIKQLQPDLVFLDVELGENTSFELLQKFNQPSFSVIFQTAHEHYALQAIKMSCLEYLLKPVSLEDLNAAIQKFYLHRNVLLNQKRIEILLDNIAMSDQANAQRISIPVNDKFVFVNVRDIIYCKSDLNTTMVITTKGERICSTKSLKNFEEVLPAYFFRCHKSVLLNINCIKSFNKNSNTVIMINNDELEVSFRKKEEFIKLFNKM